MLNQMTEKDILQSQVFCLYAINDLSTRRDNQCTIGGILRANSLHRQVLDEKQDILYDVALQSVTQYLLGGAAQGDKDEVINDFAEAMQLFNPRFYTETPLSEKYQGKAQQALDHILTEGRQLLLVNNGQQVALTTEQLEKLETVLTFSALVI